MGSAARKHKNQETKKKNKEIDAYLEKAKGQEANIMKLLLLGRKLPLCKVFSMIVLISFLYKTNFALLN